ncbi:hypothetical protein CBG55_10155 [Prevotella intermedia]|uniref:Uncharacterized protein n=1 Tax=Prevotella intermedia TaxID=28131 RepID=A0A2M8TJT1_PREIN|nr:hypothetical protein CBG55_10155 [Prevotella intermedia]PJI24191.1 hypothetical protein CTM59_08600 [Prevotella intermedia]
MEVNTKPTTPQQLNHYSVKIILQENGNCGLALRKRLFCSAKQPLLPCKTYAFGTQKRRFCNALIASELYKSFAREKCLRIYGR